MYVYAHNICADYPSLTSLVEDFHEKLTLRQVSKAYSPVEGLKSPSFYGKLKRNRVSTLHENPVDVNMMDHLSVPVPQWLYTALTSGTGAEIP